MSNWQPIETAPEDEDLRVLLSDGKKVSVGSFKPYYTSKVYSDESEIQYSWGDAHYDTWLPTHWQPLPAPPL